MQFMNFKLLDFKLQGSQQLDASLLLIGLIMKSVNYKQLTGYNKVSLKTKNTTKKRVVLRDFEMYS